MGCKWFKDDDTREEFENDINALVVRLMQMNRKLFSGDGVYHPEEARFG